MSIETPSFNELHLPEPILRALVELGYETPSPIQAQCIPLLLDGADVLGMAQTGTGKTAAFALPLLARIDLKSNKPQVLVLAPTRELAIQVAEAFQAYSRYLPNFHVLPIYGGQNYSLQFKSLKRGAQVVVGTPGRIMDHLKRGTLDLSELKAMVLDEADEMLRMGFIDDVETIMAETPSERQTALFSATMPDQIRRITKRYMRTPTEIKIKAKTSTVENIEQKAWMVSGVNKLDALTRMLETEEFDGVIIFARTKTATVELAEKLEARGYRSSALNGDMNQVLRERTVSRLKEGTLDILVATDVAARGLDVERISLVVNYDIPTDTESYVHRIGRTGRAGRTGKAILFVAPRERRLLSAIERATRQPITMMSLPTRDEVTQKRIESFQTDIQKVIEAESMEFYNQLVEQMSAELELSKESMAAALLYMAQKDKPFQLPPEEPSRERFSSGREDRPRRERSPRGERPERGERRRPDVPLDTFRIEVGREHGVQVKNIVGAIANEGNMNSRFIGDIVLHDDHSTVQLPQDMPADLLKHFQKVYICSQQIKMHKVDDAGTFNKPRRRAPKKRDTRKD
ncbi:MULTISPECIES: DEAD/DEAH box helicase [unclassified Motilimonas]|uniref:DEAD/DEAH box helicase n=1 Tax=unclassified Motilimonas TaxID=2643697 RepID=UPI001E3246C9|nr:MULTISPECIES: DEAD/DEAH box helicase [unclassified Motilimonas]MCE0559029.1 DEAD/DEAH box helicase [Motilimonas sp. E26]MDO6527014.1 DEAD/DEAH box helicase [Motilimonas sp. 1_MG-2023]